MSELWREVIVEAFRETAKGIGVFLPRFLLLIALLVIGVLVGWAIKALLLRILRAVRFDSISDRAGLTSALVRGGVKRAPSQVLDLIAFWVVFLFFAFAGVNILNLPAATDLMSVILRFLPHLLAALLVLLAGWLLANFFAQAALIAAVNAQFPGARLLATTVRWGILSLTLAMVLTQLGIAKEVVVAAFSIAFGGVVLALAIAFGLGGRDLAKELLERSLQERVKPGDEISHL
ncbi:MAG: hypothetical protein HY347_03285 [candidate division NC10 bacterium]|nr:hypothetical protein [candidate division NC10 bacterium]